jgi:hypothetical protein
MIKTILLITFFVLAGCVPKITIKYFNNTGNEVYITGCEETITVPSNQAAIFDSGCEVSIKSPNGVTWEYSNFPHISDSHLLPSGELISTQLEPDGSIYILESNTKLPSKKLDDAFHISPD